MNSRHEFETKTFSHEYPSMGTPMSHKYKLTKIDDGFSKIDDVKKRQTMSIKKT